MSAKARLLVELSVKPAEADAFVAMFRKEFIARSRTEHGCETYELWVEPDVPGRMTIIETWSSQADLDRHLAQAWFAEWAPVMVAAQAVPLVVRKMRSVED
jgi:quinol monooxygenase YgiN